MNFMEDIARQPHRRRAEFVAYRSRHDQIEAAALALFGDQQGVIREDPVTGSLNASAAQWLLSTGRAAAPDIASQGTALVMTVASI
jgi:predicted PhzF superfamily epimerase YddE/YHI9